MINEMEGRESSGQAATLMFAFITGASLGTAAGLLLAPRTGRESRDQLRDYFQKTREKLRDMGQGSGFARATTKVGEAASEAMETVSGRGEQRASRKPEPGRMT